MKIFPPEKGLTKDEICRGDWLLYADVTCQVCGKEHAKSNTNNGYCIRCGGKCE